MNLKPWDCIKLYMNARLYYFWFCLWRQQELTLHTQLPNYLCTPNVYPGHPFLFNYSWVTLTNQLVKKRATSFCRLKYKVVCRWYLLKIIWSFLPVISQVMKSYQHCLIDSCVTYWPGNVFGWQLLGYSSITLMSTRQHLVTLSNTIGIQNDLVLRVGLLTVS